MSTRPAISINGQICAKEDAKVSIFDHGFLYGDGVFEGIRIYGNRIFRGERHISRLFRSAQVIALDPVWSAGEFLAEISRLARVWQEENRIDLSVYDEPLYVRVIVSRGDGDLGLDPRKCPKPNIIIIVDTIKLYPKEWYENGLTLVTSAIRRNLSEAMPPQVKSLNYLNNILAKLDANRQGAAEAIFLNKEGYVSEATADNLFIVYGGEIRTPPVSDGALPGITREAVIELAEELGIACRECHITLYDLFSAHECFVTGTAARVVPVTLIDGRSVGSGRPGPITQRVMGAFEELVKTDGVMIEEEVRV